MKTKNLQEPRNQVDLAWAIILFLATIVYALFFQEKAPLDLFILSNSLG